MRKRFPARTASAYALGTRSTRLRVVLALGVSAYAACVHPASSRAQEGSAAGAASSPAAYAPARLLEVGVQLFAPIYPGSEDLAIGVGGRARAAWHLPMGLRPELEVGYSTQNVAGQQDPLTLLQLGLGVRYGLPRFGRLEPLIGAGLTLDYWSRSIVPGEQPDMTEVPTGPFGFPQTPDDTIWTPGFYGLAGVAFELQPWLLLDIGVRADFSFNRNVFIGGSQRVFEHSQLYWSPWVGLAYFH